MNQFENSARGKVQHGAMAYPEQQSMKSPPKNSVKLFERENQRSKRETRTIYEPHQQTTTTELPVPDLRLVKTIAAGVNVFI